MTHEVAEAPKPVMAVSPASGQPGFAFDFEMTP